MNDVQKALEDLCKELWNIAEKRLADNGISANIDEITFSTKEMRESGDVLKEGGDVENAFGFFRRRCHRNQHGQIVCPRP